MSLLGFFWLLFVLHVFLQNDFVILNNLEKFFMVFSHVFIGVVIFFWFDIFHLSFSESLKCSTAHRGSWKNRDPGFITEVNKK